MNFSEELTLSFATKDWQPIPRIARTIPFGYEIDPNDPDVLLPVPLELEALEKAKQHLKQYSLRDVALWLTRTTGRQISHMGLKKRVRAERRRGKQIDALNKLARIAEEKRAKAEKLLTQRTGAASPTYSDGLSSTE